MELVRVLMLPGAVAVSFIARLLRWMLGCTWGMLLLLVEFWYRASDEIRGRADVGGLPRWFGVAVGYLTGQHLALYLVQALPRDDGSAERGSGW